MFFFVLFPSPLVSFLQKVLFNGEECIMPPFYPDVPKKAIITAPFTAFSLSGLLVLFLALM